MGRKWLVWLGAKSKVDAVALFHSAWYALFLAGESRVFRTGGEKNRWMELGQITSGLVIATQ
jgi:hypothetical protein